jgi:hypothetical protein
MEKDLSNYWRSKDTKTYLEAVSELNSVKSTELKMTKERKYGGTYIHPDLIIHFARWINPKFAVACDRFIRQKLQREEELLESIENNEWESVPNLEERKKELQLYAKNSIENKKKLFLHD